MSIFRNHLPIMGASGQSTGYEIDQSIRFNDDDTAYMSKSISSTSSRTTWTFSTWFKVCNSGINLSFTGLFSAVNNASNFVNIALVNSSYGMDFLLYGSNSTLGRLNTSRFFRDPSAWYHLVAVLDTTNDVAGERMRLYINGERETSFTTESYPSKDTTPIVNLSGVTHNLGRAYNAGTHSGYYYDGYMAEIHLLDGYAYGPEFFGEFKDDTDIWIPKEYTGSYGTNGFKIDGRDSSDLGDDESGQGNDYTTSGLVATDQRTDSPTNNHATWNGLLNRYPSYANGNIEVTMTTSNKWAKTVMNFTLPNTGTWYWEGQEFDLEINPATAVGIVDSDVEVLIDKDLYNRFTTPMSTFTGLTVYSGPGQSIDTYLFKNGSQTSTSATPILSSSRLGFLWEPENNRFTIYDDGSQHTQFTSINAGNYVFGVQQATGGVTLNFRLFVEANDWTQTPTGITSLNALNTKNIGS